MFRSFISAGWLFRIERVDQLQSWKEGPLFAILGNGRCGVKDALAR
jgi:hypothetical protein